MQRETHKVTTPVGKTEVELYSWFTGGEKIAGGKIENEEYSEWLLKTILVSPSYEKVLEMHGKDFDFIMQEIFQITSDSTWTDKKKD